MFSSTALVNCFTTRDHREHREKMRSLEVKRGYFRRSHFLSVFSVVKKMRLTWLLAALCIASSLFLSPIQAEEDIFPFEIPKNFGLFMEKGVVNHPVTTTSFEAQQYFNQGMTLVYAFNHDAAYWSFKKAAELDPNMAMAYWGMTYALGTNINMEITAQRSKLSNELMEKARSLSQNITPNEKAYIEALSARYSKDSNVSAKKLAQNYFDAMKKVVAQFPDDLDAATLFAESGMDLNPWKQFDEEGNPREGTMEIVGVLESVLKRDPMHLGANHYYIHAIEASKNPEKGLMSAERLRKLLPNSGHLLHMPAHIYLLVGDYHLAAICNEDAIEADREYIRRFGVDGIYPVHYLSHNLYFLSRAYSMEGRFEAAKRTAEQLQELYAPHFLMMKDMEYYIPTTLFVLIRFDRWQDILELKPYDSQMAISHVLWHFGRAMAYAALGDLTKAADEQAIFNKSREQLSSSAYGYNTAGPILEIANLTLLARIAETKKDIPETVKFLKQAIAVQDKLSYNEPPDWSFSVRETLGGVLLRDQQFIEAEKVFREDLDRHPRNGRSLYGLLQTLIAQKRHDDAFWVNREFEKAWKYSPISLTPDDL